MVIVDRSYNPFNCFAAYAGVIKRPTKKTPKTSYRKSPDFVFQKSLTIWCGLHNSDQKYFWFFCRACEKQAKWEK